MAKRKTLAVRGRPNETQSAAPAHQPSGQGDTVRPGNPGNGVRRNRSLFTARSNNSVVIVAAVALGCVALQPISSDQAWWQLSCGRQAILSASLWPSVDLLVFETQGEANAVGAGVATLPYLILGASGWMLVRVGVVIAALVFVLRSFSPPTNHDESSSGNLPLRLASLSVVLAALSPALDPVPILFDVLAIACVAFWTTSQTIVLTREWPMTLACLACLFLFWANFGDHVLVGILIVAAVGWPDASSSASSHRLAPLRQTVVFVATAIIAAMVNPIGWRVFIDSFSQSFPWAVAPAWTLVGTQWVPLTQVAWGIEHAVFVVLTLVVGLVVCLWPGQRYSFFGLLVVQFLAWTNAVLLPLAIVWMAVWLWNASRPWPAIAPRLQPVAAILVMMMVSAGIIRDVGWGFRAELDPRMLEFALADLRQSGTIFADSTRSAGMIAWVTGSTTGGLADNKDVARLQDEPRRALAGGRLVEHRRVLADLRDGQQMSYWRDDQSQGGWWLPLIGRETSLLVCWRRDLQLIRRLEPTIWKPLTLDSPVLVYARAGDPVYTQKIVDVLGQREWIDSGLWDYRPLQSTGSAYDRDRFGLWGMASQAGASFDQAEVFVAIDLQIAALKVLDHLRRAAPNHARHFPIWQRCQIELADWERVNTGQASWLRALASQPPKSSLGRSDGEIQPETWQADLPTGQSLAPWLKWVATYRLQGAAVALQLCESATSGIPPSGWNGLSSAEREQLHYAAICLAIECGRLDEAIQWARALREDQNASPSIRLLAQHQLATRHQSATDGPIGQKASQ